MESDVALAGNQENTLLELLDRLLNTGVVLCGDLVVSVADIELLYLRLQLTLSSVETARKAGWFVPALHCGDVAGPHLPERAATEKRYA